MRQINLYTKDILLFTNKYVLKYIYILVYYTCTYVLYRDMQHSRTPGCAELPFALV